MRVISGRLRGKKLISASSEVTRPTSDRAKEGLFNILNHILLKQEKKWEEIVFVDVFSGSGSIGIEAYSRGAKEVILFENNPLAIQAIKQNIKNLNIELIQKSACFPAERKKRVDVLFFDAPYGKNLWQESIQSFKKQGWITNETVIIVEIDKEITEEIPEQFLCERTQDYGRNRFLFLRETKNELKK